MNWYFLYERIYGTFFRKKPKRLHFNFEIHITDYCNLNCKGCFHFSPLVKQGQIYPYDEFEKEIMTISKIFNGKFGWIHLLGGEPLLNKDINKYLDCIGKYVKKGKVSLITNGLLLTKMDDSFYETCKRNNIEIAVSKYPLDIDYQKMKEYVASKGVKFIFFGEDKNEFSFMSLGKGHENEFRKRYLSCNVSNACVTLDHGKLYYCSASAYIRFFNEKFNENYDNSTDSISIYGHNKKDILNFLRTPHHFCGYCDVKLRDSTLFPWKRSELKRQEWEK